mmetsp:Transcript_38549/g.77731  ORF Transcript_38549/g.77731 Transcript_38549/m.77731 type:complete len:242 (+) Transcript_38549:536-1261(+)
MSQEKASFCRRQQLSTPWRESSKFRPRKSRIKECSFRPRSARGAQRCGPLARNSKRPRGNSTSALLAEAARMVRRLPLPPQELSQKSRTSTTLATAPSATKGFLRRLRRLLTKSCRITRRQSRRHLHACTKQRRCADWNARHSESRSASRRGSRGADGYERRQSTRTTNQRLTEVGATVAVLKVAAAVASIWRVVAVVATATVMVTQETPRCSKVFFPVQEGQPTMTLREKDRRYHQQQQR